MFTVILLHALSVLTWPRRRAAAAWQDHLYRAAQRRELLADCERLAAEPRPVFGSMSFHDDPLAREPGYLGTWTPHDEAWLAEHTAHLAADMAAPDVPSAGRPSAPVPPSGALAAAQAAPPALGTYVPPSRLATAQDWYDAMTAPDLERRLAAERGALERYLERETARFHHEHTLGGNFR